MELVFKNMDGNALYKLNTTLSGSNIYGILGDGQNEFFELMRNLSFDKGIIMLNSERLLKKDYPEFTKTIKILEENKGFVTVEEELNYFLLENKLKVKDISGKISTSLKLVGLNDTYLSRNTNTLSLVEKKLLSLAKALLGEFTILMIDGLFELLDRKLRQKIYRLFVKIKEKKNVVILIGSRDIEILYQYTDKLILFSNKEIVLECNTKEIPNHLEIFDQHKLDIPEILMFTNLAKAKGVKIDYHKDVRDLIKDVYKHV